MRRLACLSLATMGMALAVPLTARADDAPASRSAAASTIVIHKHSSHLKGKHLCEKCAAAKAAKEAKEAKVAGAEPPFSLAGAKIVGCAHSKNGVCKECRTLLEMPGKLTMVGSDDPSRRIETAQAPGRAVASDTMAARTPSRATVASGEPEPIGVMRTNYTAPAGPAGPSGIPAAPGRAVVQSGDGGHAPFLSPTPESSPHIIGHLFGLSEMANDFQDWRASRGKRKRDAHAAIPYGHEGSQVEELPASMVFGNGAR